MEEKIIQNLAVVTDILAKQGNCLKLMLERIKEQEVRIQSLELVVNNLQRK